MPNSANVGKAQERAIVNHAKANGFPGADRQPLLQFQVEGMPGAQGSKRHVGKGHMVESSKKVEPWRNDVNAAAQAAIPDLDTYWPKQGQCQICGVPGEDQRHRVIDAIRERYQAGDSIEDLVDDYELNRSGDAVRAALFPYAGPVDIAVVFVFPRPKSHYRTGKNAHLLRDGAPARPTGKNVGDIDKLLRSTYDALTNVVWDDDSQVVDVQAAKVYAQRGEKAGAHIFIEPADRLTVADAYTLLRAAGYGTPLEGDA